MYCSNMFLGFQAEVKGDALPPEYDEERMIGGDKFVDGDLAVHVEESIRKGDVEMDTGRIQARLFARGLMERIRTGMANQPRPVVRYRADDPLLHTADAPFCDDLSCDCHRDRELLDEYVYAPIQAGIMTMDEARRLWYGGGDEKDVPFDFERQVI